MAFESTNGKYQCNFCQNIFFAEDILVTVDFSKTEHRSICKNCCDLIVAALVEIKKIRKNNARD